MLKISYSIKFKLGEEAAYRETIVFENVPEEGAPDYIMDFYVESELREIDTEYICPVIEILSITEVPRLPETYSPFNTTSPIESVHPAEEVIVPHFDSDSTNEPEENNVHQDEYDSTGARNYMDELLNEEPQEININTLYDGERT
jgi:hypothetical protein